MAIDNPSGNPFDSRTHYTAREWDFIVQPHEFDWPDGWLELREDRGLWEPMLRDICEQFARS